MRHGGKRGRIVGVLHSNDKNEVYTPQREDEDGVMSIQRGDTESREGEVFGASQG